MIDPNDLQVIFAFAGTIGCALLFFGYVWITEHPVHHLPRRDPYSVPFGDVPHINQDANRET